MVKDIYICLSEVERWPGQSQHLHIMDNFTNVSRDYCFLDKEPFRSKKHAFFISLVE